MPAEPQQISQLGGLDELEAGDRAQQLARLGADALGVGEVAGVVVGDACSVDRVALGARLVLGEQLGDVADLRRERLGAPPSRSSSVAVVLHRRAAAGGVRDDESKASNAAIVVPRALARARSASPACSWSAPQHPGARGRVDLAALGGQHRDRRAVDVAEEHALDAALQEADAAARRSPRGGRDVGQRRRACAAARAAPARPSSRSRRDERGRAGANGSSGTSARSRPGAGTARRRRRRLRRSARGRACARSTCGARVARSAGRTARRTGTRSRTPCSRGSGRSASTIAGDSSPPRGRARMSTMRPRGESISSPHSTYVGHVGRQKPQCTQSSISVGLGRACVVERSSPCSDASHEDARGCSMPRRVEARLDAGA